MASSSRLEILNDGGKSKINQIKCPRTALTEQDSAMMLADHTSSDPCRSTSPHIPLPTDPLRSLKVSQPSASQSLVLANPDNGPARAMIGRS